MRCNWYDCLICLFKSKGKFAGQVAEALLEGHRDIMTALDIDLRSPVDLAEEADAVSVLSLLR